MNRRYFAADAAGTELRQGRSNAVPTKLKQGRSNAVPAEPRQKDGSGKERRPIDRGRQTAGTALTDRPGKKIRSYRELMRLGSFEERLAYLRLAGTVGADTFGFDRWLNQQFYGSQEWKQVRNLVIARDCGCDLGISDRPIPGRIYVHHMNPVTKEDLEKEGRALFLGPEYLICVSHETHNAIHYGSEAREASLPAERKPNDTCPWKR